MHLLWILYIWFTFPYSTSDILSNLLTPRLPVTDDGVSFETCSNDNDEDRIIVWNGFMENIHLKYIIQELWNAKYKKGFVSTNIDDIESRAVQGSKGLFSFVLNPERSKKKNLSVVQKWVSSPFDPKLFNFLSVPRRELMFALDFPLKSRSHRSSGLKCSSDVLHHDHYVIINAFPVGKYSIVIAPFMTKKLPQKMTHDALLVGIRISMELRYTRFKIGFNSLAAYASVNHLHFQTYQVSGVRSHGHRLPIDVAHKTWFGNFTCVDSGGDSTSGRYQFGMNDSPISVFTLDEYAVRSFAFQFDWGQEADAACVVWNLLQCLLDENIPHSIIISNDKIFVAPRQPQAEVKYDFHPGYPEVAGEIIMLSNEEYYNLKADDVYDEMRRVVSLSSANFDKVKAKCLT